METLSRIPPHSEEAEVSILGGLLIDDVFDVIGDILNPEMFYLDKHQKIFAAMRGLIDKREPIDLTTIVTEISRLNQLDEVGSVSYLVGLTREVPTTAHIEHYAKIVREKYILRSLIKTSNNNIKMAYDQQVPLEDLLNLAEKGIFEIAHDDLKDTTDHDISRLVMQTLEYMEMLQKNKGIPDGIKTGFVSLDNQISGLQKGSLNVLAARPSMGKTAFAMGIVQNIVIRDKKSVAVFSLEMPAMHLIMRMICSEAHVNMSNSRSGTLKDAHFMRLIEASSKISESRLFIDDDPNLNINNLRTKLRRTISKQGPLDLVVIDYLQLMSGTSRGYNENRQQEVSNISRGLKNLARELDVPIIVLSQLSRAVEQRPNKRPMLSDLRESGAIEQDADIVMFIYRDDYYNSDSELQGIAEIIISKQRNGPTGTVEMHFNSNHVSFSDMFGYENTANTEIAKMPDDFE